MIDSTPDWDALFALLGPIHDDVQLFARRIARSAAEGDDVFQEAVLRAARKLGSLRDRARFKPWMMSVVVSVHRTRRREPFWRRWIASPLPDPVGDDGARWAEDRASAERAKAALGTLDPAQREAIVLFELHGHAIEEIAEIQGASVSAVKSRLARGRTRLRRFYEALGPSNLTHFTEEVCRG